MNRRQLMLSGASALTLGALAGITGAAAGPSRHGAVSTLFTAFKHFTAIEMAAAEAETSMLLNRARSGGGDEYAWHMTQQLADHLKGLAFIPCTGPAKGLMAHLYPEMSDSTMTWRTRPVIIQRVDALPAINPYIARLSGGTIAYEIWAGQRDREKGDAPVGSTQEWLRLPNGDYALVRRPTGLTSEEACASYTFYEFEDWVRQVDPGWAAAHPWKWQDALSLG